MASLMRHEFAAMMDAAPPPPRAGWYRVGIDDPPPGLYPYSVTLTLAEMGDGSVRQYWGNLKGVNRRATDGD